MEYRVNKHWFINRGNFLKRLICDTGKFKSNNMAKWSDIRELWVRYEIKLESAKDKTKSKVLQ